MSNPPLCWGGGKQFDRVILTEVAIGVVETGQDIVWKLDGTLLRKPQPVGRHSFLQAGEYPVPPIGRFPAHWVDIGTPSKQTTKQCRHITGLFSLQAKIGELFSQKEMLMQEQAFPAGMVSLLLELMPNKLNQLCTPSGPCD